ENRRPPRRTHLGGVAARPRLHLPFHPAQAAKGRRSNPMTASAESTPPVEILLVEDNPGDVRLTKEALREGKVYSTLHWAKDGVEALEFLRRQGPHANAPRPDIILLDLNLPKKDGREVLQDIKNDEKL